MGGSVSEVLHSRRSWIAAVCALVLMLVAGAAFMAGCGKKDVSLEYEPRPDVCLVKVESSGGLPYPGDDLMPLFQLFGDGRFVKYQEETDGRGVFVQGSLDGASVSDLLRSIHEAGFFDLKGEYMDPDAYDVSSRTIALDLVETEKTVAVDTLNDVPAFDEVYELILQYPVGAVSGYVPEQGYLVVVKYPLESVEDTAYLDPASDVFKLLPDMATLYRAAADHVAVAVDGATFAQLKDYDNARGSKGFYILQPEAVVAVYPVYEPRIVDKP